MREKPSQWIERHRVVTGRFASDASYGNSGMFEFRRNGVNLRVIACDLNGWDHVSVSTPHRCPTWEEMCWIKDLFFLPSECCVQFHPPTEVYVNDHNYCLHLWRPHNAAVALPPRSMV